MADQTGGIGDDLLLGTAEADGIRGDGDTLSGGGTDAGSDTVLARGGDDTVFGDAETLTLGAQGGNDAILGGGGNDRLYGDAELFGLRDPGPVPGGAPGRRTGGGEDLIRGGRGDDTIWGDAGRAFDGDFGVDTIAGGPGDDLVFGDVERAPFLSQLPGDLITGGAGNDTLHGDVRLIQLNGPIGSGDTIRGGAGNDLIYGDAYTHVLLVGADETDLRWRDLADVRTGGLADTLAGGSGDDTLVGDVAYVADGGGGRDLLGGGSGDDLLYGDGIDQYLVRMGDDTLNGGEGSDVLYGDAARAGFVDLPGPPLTGPFDLGRAGSDLLAGGAGRDFLYGDAPVLFAPLGLTAFGFPVQIPGAADTLDGGADADVLFGGGGPDVFVLRRGETEGDEILDFSGAGGDGDTIRLEGFGDGATVATDGAFHVVQTADGAAERFRLQGGAALGAGDVVFA